MAENQNHGSRGVLVMLEDSGNSLSLFDSPVGQALRRHWLLIAGLAVVAAVTTFVICKISPKWYRAQVVLALAPQESNAALNSLGGQIGGLAALAGLDIGGGEGFKEEAIARLTSREFTFAFINEKQLLPVLFASDWDPQAKDWRSSKRTPSMERAYKFFTQEVYSVAEDRRNGLVNLTIDWKDPQLAMQWANELVGRINADRRAVARADAQRNLEYLSKELEKASIVEVRQLLNRLVESEMRKAMMANVREQYAFRVVDPAFLPGRQNIVRPRAVVLSAIALLGGAALGVLLALGLHALRTGRENRAASIPA